MNTPARTLKILGIVFLIVSAIGFLDATYLTVEHYRGAIPPCSVEGCEIVLTSAYSTVAGIPIALFGALFYLTVLILSLYFLDSKNAKALRAASYLTIPAFLTSLVLVYLQLFVLKNICQYCMVSAVTSTVLFIFGIYTILEMKKVSP